MSQIDAINAGFSPPLRTRGMGDLTSSDFSKIIFTELGNQDPMSPNDTNALLQQISTLRSIQADADLSDQLQSLVNQNQFTSGASLLGRRVSGISEANQRVQGTVRSVSNTPYGAVVSLDNGARVFLSQVDELLAPSN
ncbi:MAG: flagellar hook capping FlgD N-terminal domain-containing protein [Phycisphaerae bacterium]|jgi:flagellar basal-body rod modification protein FlgD